MKKILLATVAAVSLFALSSCSSSPSGNPEKDAKNLVKMCVKGNVEDAVKFTLKLDEMEDYDRSAFSDAMDEEIENLNKEDRKAFEKASIKISRKVQEEMSKAMDDLSEDE